MKKLIALLGCSLLGNMAVAADSDYPLFLSNNVDPNVLFNLSIETPMGGAAYNDQKGNLPGGSYCSGRVSGNLGTCYFPRETYLGYFDSEKCYNYHSDKKYFIPKSAVINANRECSRKFSGNFMNWATMTSIDMFIMTTTGGNRIIDESNGKRAKTVVKKATSSGFFHNKKISSSLNIRPSKVTPYNRDNLEIYKSGSNVIFKSGTNFTRTLAVNIQVCKPNIIGLGLEGLEENCDKYTHATKGDYYKPQGLMQNNANTMRFAATSFARDNSRERDGGVLRANMKYIGRQMPNGLGNISTNPNSEITAQGTFVKFPDAKTHSSNQYTGIINYINHFNELGYKSFDPASELFYESIRYFKNLGPTNDYSKGISLANEKFPLITNWQDPIQHSCQKNFIIGMNDAYSWLDKKLPGTYFTKQKIGSFTVSNKDYGQPSNPDRSINVRKLTNEVGSIEGISRLNCANGSKSLGDCAYTGRHASFYIAGLAHYANTQDIRSDLEGKQTISSFIIDSQEYTSNPSTGNTNMLWLAGKYGGYIDEDGDGTPNNKDGSNKEWDVDGDGSPDNYVLASNPQRIVEGLSTAFEQIIERSASGSGVSLSANNLSSNTTLFQSTFNNDDWSGEVVAYNIDDSVTLDDEKWRASEEIPAYGQRKMYSHNGSTGTEFLYEKLSAQQKTQISVDQVNYLRGQQSKEVSKNNGIFRNRTSLLGDIIHSTPTVDYQYNYGFNSLSGREGEKYLTFRNSSNYKNRKQMIYVAANDGMLHAFNSESGKETFSYVPGSFLSELAKLTSPAYQHNYLLDGEITLGDAYLSSNWKTVLIGNRGRGGSTIFALDVSTPSNFSKDNVLWEISATDSDYSDLGIQLGRPKIVRLNNGKWAAVFGNGYRRDTPIANPNSEAYLYIVDLEDGSLIKKIAAPSSGLNGLSEVSIVDRDNDHKTDFIYAGDLLGNMWKFDISSTDSDDWAVANQDSGNPVPLFSASYRFANTATDIAQPITVAPTIIKHHIKGYLLLFGTGKYYEAEDNTLLTNDPVHSFYGIHDNLSQVAGTRDNLIEQSILYEEYDSSDNFRATSNNNLDYNQKNGWFLDLINPENTLTGEKVNLQALYHNEKVIFFTIIPSQDPCAAGGSSWTMILNAIDGRAGDTAVSDSNNDGKIDDKDKKTVKDKNGNDISVVVTGSSQDNIIVGGGITTNSQGNTVLITSDAKGQVQTELLGSPEDDSGRISWQQIR